MKTTIKKLFVFIIVIAMLSFAINAAIPESISPYWVNTRRVAISHVYDYGTALCFVEIKGLDDVDSIQNVDIIYSVDIDGEWVELASWEDLSVTGNLFRFESSVPNVELSYTYRLSFTADVHRNGTIEWLNQYYDNTY